MTFTPSISDPSKDNSRYHLLTPKCLGMRWLELSTVATDGLVLKHQAINNRSANQLFILLDPFHNKISYQITWKNKTAFWNKNGLMELGLNHLREVNSVRLSDAYMPHKTNRHWFR